jgi:stearoyl-CoA desaturase (delta-9 desaturase)
MPKATEAPIADPSAELPEKAPSVAVKLVMLLAIVVPLGGVVAAPLYVWGWGFQWTDLGLLLGMYVLTVLGITVGFHRLFVHRSFDTYDWVKFLWAAIGSMAVQGSLFRWVARHRRHHQHADTPDDPHTPHHHGRGVIGLLRGLWHAHVGWLFEPDPPDLDHYIKDLTSNRLMRLASQLFPLWVALGLVIPAALGGIITRTWQGAWTGLIWGGLVRIFLVHHVTWSVNSACHVWGRQPYASDDESRNNLLFGILALGEGWHNTHHAFPTSARHGLRWWQIDVSYWVIRLMAWLHLAWNVHLPSLAAQAKEQRTATNA